MRIPLILMLVIIIATPKDVRGLMDDVSTQMQQASVSMAQMFGDGRREVAEVQ